MKKEKEDDDDNNNNNADMFLWDLGGGDPIVVNFVDS